MGAYYIFLKTVKNKSAKLTKNVIFLLIFIVTAIELYETINGNELNGIIITLLLLILLFDWVSTDTMSFTILSLGISYVIFFASVVIIGILNIQVSMVYWEILINVEKKEKS